MSTCRGEGEEGGIFNYLVLCRINELHHQLLFLNTFCKEKGENIYKILVIVFHAAVHYSLLYKYNEFSLAVTLKHTNQMF